MAIIVRHADIDADFILLGGGFGAWKALRSSRIFGDLVPHEASGELPVVLVCDAHGATRWIKSEGLEVVSVDGRKPADVLGDGLGAGDS